ncbi:MAG TPA: VWA domain-containing protein [Gemmatimonadales bacterium]|nr:VWA domain-containing protein [Gemmatimonadales bacterium]
MRFVDPWLLLLLLAPAWLGWRWWRSRRQLPPHRISFPALRLAAVARPSTRARLAAWSRMVTLVGLAILVAALARPQIPGDSEPTRVRSRNLILALDISSSMKATDFQPGNRLAVARQVLRDFIKRRQGDLVGLVIFSGRAFLQAPLTNDLNVLDRLAAQVDIGDLPDGTAIGNALMLCLDQLKNLPKNSSAIILLTDGANNAGDISPEQAAEAARAVGVRIHTIGLSSADTFSAALNGVWSVRNINARLSGSDEAVLKDIATRTGGQFYKATDPNVLSAVLKEIDPMERIEVKVSETREWHDLFPTLVGVGLALLLAEMLLRVTWFRTAP